MLEKIRLLFTQILSEENIRLLNDFLADTDGDS